MRRLLPRFGTIPAAAAWLSLLAWAGTASAQDVSRPALAELAAYPGLENVSLSYDAVRILGTTWVLQGDVDLTYPDSGVRLLADELRFDLDTKAFSATGNVSFEQGELLLNGTSMSGDLDDGTMTMEEAIGVAPGPFYVRAERIQQLEPGKFKVEGGVMTPCNQTTPIWEFRSGSMTFRPGKYVQMMWPHLRVKGLPIFGFPYLYWPLQESQRQTGFLLPEIGVSNRKGFMLSETFFWAINRSMDLTATYEHFANAGSGFAGEFRHRLGESSSGSLRGYYLPGREVTPEEAAAGRVSFSGGFQVTGSYLQALPEGIVLRSQANFISSLDFVRDFQDDVHQFLQRQSMASIDLSKSWGASTLTLVGDHRENFISRRDSFVGRRLPQIKYSLRSTQLAGPVYFAGQASAARFEKQSVTELPAGDTRSIGGSYQRFDAFPEVQVQITQIPWLTFQPFARWRSTYWTHRTQGNNDFRFVDESVFRNFYETGVEMVGPSIFKIFETPTSEYSPRFKHLIQPRLSYRRVRELDADNLRRIITFDEVDSSVSERQEMVASLTTRLFAKRYLNPQDEQRQVWQVFEVTFGRSFDLDPLPEQLEELGVPRIQLPWFAVAVVQPSDGLYLQSSVSFTPDLKPANINVSSQINHDLGFFRANWFRGARNFLDPTDPTTVLVETNSHAIGADTQLDLFGRAVTLGGGITMDLLASKLQNINGSFRWNLQCCSIGVDVRHFNFTGRQETQFGILLQLAQVGQVGFDG